VQKLIKNLYKHFVISLVFFTKIPIPKLFFPSQNDDMKQLKYAIAYFPLIGALIGFVAWIFIKVNLEFLPKNILIVLLLCLLMYITGGLHEDGLADAFDAFGSQFKKKDILRVMKDSRIGTFGTLAIVAIFFLKFTTLSNIESTYLGAIVCTAQILSRWIILPMMLFLRYPYKSTSPSKFFVESINNMPWWIVIISSIFSIGSVILILGYNALYLILATSIIGIASGFYYHHKIQGATGDCLGATQQISEVVIYLIFIFIK